MANEKKIKLLNNIQSPDDLRRLNIEQLPELCNELREKIIEGLRTQNHNRATR